jgi:hypothetical protein
MSLASIPAFVETKRSTPQPQRVSRPADDFGQRLAATQTSLRAPKSDDNARAPARPARDDAHRSSPEPNTRDSGPAMSADDRPAPTADMEKPPAPADGAAQGQPDRAPGTAIAEAAKALTPDDPPAKGGPDLAALLDAALSVSGQQAQAPAAEDTGKQPGEPARPGDVATLLQTLLPAVLTGKPAQNKASGKVGQTGDEVDDATPAAPGTDASPSADNASTALAGALLPGQALPAQDTPKPTKDEGSAASPSPAVTGKAALALAPEPAPTEAAAVDSPPPDEVDPAAVSADAPRSRPRHDAAPVPKPTPAAAAAEPAAKTASHAQAPAPATAEQPAPAKDDAPRQAGRKTVGATGPDEPSASPAKPQLAAPDPAASIVVRPEPSPTAASAAPGRPAPAQADARPHAATPVPVSALPVELGLRALEGGQRFEIRLRPEELGRVDVRLDIGEDGSVKAQLTVDRVETLALLQRDARTLERAFEQAGLKTSEGSIAFSLGQSGGDAERRQAQRQAETDSQAGRDSARHDEENARAASAVTAALRAMNASARGLDIRI